MSNRVITGIGVLLGAAIVGIPLGAYAARKWRCDQPTKAYDQAGAITTSLGNLKGARR